ncbi:hypothetical protein RV11_GL003201 [Enterococcus phoeniculicola]|uniref:Uncharacterized protein n=2 Tax=Enterococcus phoeniculicola TaxID=154621 RepID=R3WMD4_9ENTE|nr:hypothetical protein UC3_01957 [Enterococcus phoeniculicola ATCC BAA-412]EOT76662.1 hypothetical protein I589_01619 [Enterococcus phoeniculicola ATCC BAA-412]OJG72230.1 hypothetical protein RV11_GL003201 [Enterococcus phoeniculicola]
MSILFPIITYPYITRILSTEGLGKFEFSRTIINYFILVINIGLGQYAIREGSILRKDHLKMQKFSNEMFSIYLWFTLISYFVLFSLLIFIPAFQGYEKLILIFSIQIVATTFAVEWVFSIYEDFTFLTLKAIAVQICAIILMFLLVKTTKDYTVYAWITTLSFSLAVLFNFQYAKKYITLHYTKKMNFRKHWNPILYLSANSIASTIYLSADIILLGFLAGDHYVGIYSISVKIYSIVKSLADGVIYAVSPRLTFYKSNNKTKEYEKTLNDLFWLLLTFLVPIEIGILFFSKTIIYLIAGNQFINSVSSLIFLTVGMIPSIFFSFLLFTVLLVNKKEKTILRATLYTAILNILGNFIIVPLRKTDGSAIATVISEFFIACIAFYYSRHLFKIEFRLKTFLSILIGGCTVCLICTLFQTLYLEQIQTMLLSVGFSFISYTVILYRLHQIPKI